MAEIVVVGIARIVLHIPGSHSLKDKRQVVRSLLAQVQTKLHLSAAEVAEQDQWQVAVLAIACVSTSPGHADEMLANAIRFVEVRASEASLLDYETEVIHPF